MADDDCGCARLTVTLPTDVLTSVIRIAGRLRLTPSQIVERACHDFLTREPPGRPSLPAAASLDVAKTRAAGREVFTTVRPYCRPERSSEPCRDGAERSNAEIQLSRIIRLRGEPSPPEKGRTSSYVEMTVREGAHDLPPLRSSTIDFRPLRRSPSERALVPVSAQSNAAARDNRAAHEGQADLQRGFRRIAQAATTFAEEHARRGSWLCEPAQSRSGHRRSRTKWWNLGWSLRASATTH